MAKKHAEKKMTHEQFVIQAIKTLRKNGYKGIHSVYSGFNQAFKEYFPGENPVEATSDLAEEGKIAVRFVRGGAMLYLPEDAPQEKSAGEEALKKMGLKK